MRTSKTISILFFASILFIVSTVIASDKFLSVEKGLSGEDALFVGMLEPKKGEAGMPDGLDEQNFPLNDDDVIRGPASVKKAAHWSASTSEGFQYKIRIKKQLSSVWVLKRGEDRYDLIFASNSGSRVNLTLPAQQFYALKNAATDLRAPASDLKKCKDSYVQIEVVEEKTLKTVEACLSASGAQAEQLRQFGYSLTALVR